MQPDEVKRMIVSIMAHGSVNVPESAIAEWKPVALDIAVDNGYVTIGERSHHGRTSQVVSLTESGREAALAEARRHNAELHDDSPEWEVAASRKATATGRFDQIYPAYLTREQFDRTNPDQQIGLHALDDMSDEAKKVLSGMFRARLEVQPLTKEDLTHLLTYTLEYTARLEADRDARSEQS